MSYPSLVGYAHHPQAKSEQFSNEIIFFVIERGAAQMADRGRMIDRIAVLFVYEGALARFPNPIGHHVHCPVERNLLPLFRPWRSVLHFCFAAIVGEELIRRCAFGTKIALADRTLRVAFD